MKVLKVSSRFCFMTVLRIKQLVSLLIPPRFLIPPLEVARCRREQQEILIVLLALQTSNPAATLQKYGLLPFGEQKNFKKIISEK